MQLSAAERYEKRVAADSRSMVVRFRNAAIEGYQTVIDTAFDMLLFLLSNGPILLLTAALLFWPIRALWRKRSAFSIHAKNR